MQVVGYEGCGPYRSTNAISSYARIGGEESQASNQGEKGRAEQSGAERLDGRERAQVERLEARDRQVRAHEAAHIAVGGSLVRGGANFEYEIGPDGKAYAVGGEVSIDISKGDTPEETIQKMQQVRAAAMAPSDPSPQDYRVAASAAMMEARARAELAERRSEELSKQLQKNSYEDKNSLKIGQTTIDSIA